VWQTCALLNIGPTTVWKLISTGELETTRIGRRRLVLFSSLQKLLHPVNSQPAKGKRGKPREARFAEREVSGGPP
jgi:excisionase family DNA binding protein